MRRAFLFIAALTAFAIAQAQEYSPDRFFVKLNAPPSRNAVGGMNLSPSAVFPAEVVNKWLVRDLRCIAPKSAGLSKAGESLESFVLITINSPSDIEKAAQEFASLPGVEYVQREHLYHVDVVPNDSAYESQWAVKRVGMERAWEISKGSSSIAVGVIDTGIDYFHPDLKTQLRINTEEDVNGNGRFDPWPISELRDGVAGDFDSLDNDGNGYIDDVAGYDFVDRPDPANAGGGDYRDRDPDPLDDMGHGSSVSGIIAAAFDNGVGVAGIAPNCKLVPLRAFDARGVGAEGDVAQALAYAVANGISVVNMSFGDVSYSRVLRDIVRYAYNAGVVLVASAGNAASPVLHYPSAYDETISVTGSMSNDGIASFSNYGQSIDVTAPGVDVTTTDMQGRYTSFNGTSASAPFVSAAAALLRSIKPALTPEEVKGIIAATADDKGKQGWDDRYGAGILNIARALEMPNPSEVKILSPKTDWAGSGTSLPIVGTAASPLMSGYEVVYGEGINPSSWNAILPYTLGQVYADTLALWNIAALKDTVYTISLVARSNKGTSLVDKVVIRIDRKPPEFAGVGFVPSMEGKYGGAAAGCVTDEPVLARIYYRPKGSADEWKWKSLEPETENNLFISGTQYGYLGFPGVLPGAEYECYISATNEAGLETVVRPQGSYFPLPVPQPAPETGFEKKGYSLGLSRLHTDITDFNGNGRPEILLNDNAKDNAFSVLEYDGNALVSIGGAALGNKIPRGVGDLNGDGKPELLMSLVRNGFLYTQSAPNTVPDQLVWGDSTSGYFWPITIADVNNDSRSEVLAVINDSTVGVFTFSESFQIAKIGEIVNPTTVPFRRRNFFSAPRCAMGDFNNNGRTDLLFGDADGDFFIAESQGGGSFTTIWTQENDFEAGSDFVAAGDFDADGRDEFAVGYRTTGDDIIPFWVFTIFNMTPGNSVSTLWTQQFYGVAEGAQGGVFARIQNSLSAGNIDDDPETELIINVYPEMYVVDFNKTATRMDFLWFLPLANTNAVPVVDLDGNGVKELVFGGADSVVVYEKTVPYAGPPAPRSLHVEYLSDTDVRVQWAVGEAAASYRIYRGPTASALELLGEAQGTAFTDFQLVPGETYVYAVAGYDTNRTPAESPRIVSRILRPHARPVVDSVLYVQGGQVMLKVSPPEADMGSVIPSVAHFYLVSGQNERQPESVLLFDRTRILLSFGALADGEYYLRLTGLRDGEGIPFEDNLTIPFSVLNASTVQLCIKTVELIDGTTLAVRFNMALAKASAERAANYRIDPLGEVSSARLDDNNHALVYVTLPAGTHIGALGREYVLKAAGITSSEGVALDDGACSTAGIILNKQTLDDMFVYPNPLRPEDDQEFVTFANLTPKAAIRIYTLSGVFIREVKEEDGNGGIEWLLDDDGGKKVPSGIYVYYASGTNAEGKEVEPKTGKFALIRR